MSEPVRVAVSALNARLPGPLSARDLADVLVRHGVTVRGVADAGDGPVLHLVPPGRARGAAADLAALVAAHLAVAPVAPALAPAPPRRAAPVVRVDEPAWAVAALWLGTATPELDRRLDEVTGAVAADYGVSFARCGAAGPVRLREDAGAVAVEGGGSGAGGVVLVSVDATPPPDVAGSGRERRAVEAALRVLHLLGQDGAGAAALAVDAPPPPEPLRVPFGAGDVAGTLGVRLDHAALADLLALGGLAITGGTEVLVPAWREDVRDGAAVLAEVARLLGADALAAPAAGYAPGGPVRERPRRRMREVAARKGFQEVVTRTLLPVELVRATWPASPPPALAVGRDRGAPLVARPSLLPGLLSVAATNATEPLLSVFETGVVLDPAPHPDDPRLPTEHQHFAFLRARRGDPVPERLADADLWDVVDAARHVVLVVGGEDLDVVSAPVPCPGPFRPGRAFALLLRGERVGLAGDLEAGARAPKAPPAAQAYAWLDVDALLARAPRHRPFVPVDAGPVTTFDLTLLVPAAVDVPALLGALGSGAGALAEDVAAVDSYAGVAAGATALTCRVRLRATDRAVTRDELAAARAGALDAAAPFVLDPGADPPSAPQPRH